MEEKNEKIDKNSGLTHLCVLLTQFHRRTEQQYSISASKLYANKPASDFMLARQHQD